MGSVVTFWRLPDEEADFVEYLESGEPVVAVPHRFYATADGVRWLPVREAFASTDGSKFLITPARFSSAARVKWVEGGYPEPGYAIDFLTAPVRYYLRGKLSDDNRLYSASVNVSWEYHTDDHSAVRDHPTDFIRWSKRVTLWIRKSTPLWYRYKKNRSTPKADAARLNGLELVI